VKPAAAASRLKRHLATLMVASAAWGCSGTVGHADDERDGVHVDADVLGMGGASGTGGMGHGGKPPIPPLVETDLGEVAAGSVVGIDVPPGTLSMTAVLRPPSDTDVVGFESLTPPSGPAEVQGYRIPGTIWDFAWYGITVAALPQSDSFAAMPPMPGTWQVAIGAPETTVANAKLSVWRRQTLDGKFHGGLIDVNVFIAGDATTPEYMTEVVTDAFGSWAGLALGNVAFHPVSSEYQVLDTIPQVFDVLQLTKAAAGAPALNVIVVGTLTGELMGASALAAGIPGFGLQHGTNGSGLVMTITGEGWLDRVVLRHETGHMAGLFHTTELEAGAGDALADTPKCFDPINSLGGCADSSNIMFPFTGYGDELSEKQQLVIQGSALYRGIVEEGGGAADPFASPTSTSSEAPHRPPLAPIDPGGPGPSPGAWASALPASAATVLASGWCARTGQAPWTALSRADAGALLSVGLDARAPAYVRRRALIAAGRASSHGELIEALAVLAADTSAPRLVRVGAFEGLSSASAERAATLRATLAGDADSVVSAVAR
jgi:hypothetical protein